MFQREGRYRTESVRHILADCMERHDSTADGCPRKSFTSLWPSYTDIHLPSQLIRSQRMAHCKRKPRANSLDGWRRSVQIPIVPEDPPNLGCHCDDIASFISGRRREGRSAHRESEAGASSFDREYCSAQIAVVLENVHHRLARARLHTTINAHVSGLCPAQKELKVYFHQLDRIRAVCSEGPKLAAPRQNTANVDCPHLRSADTQKEPPDLFLSSSLTSGVAWPKDVLLALISRSLQPSGHCMRMQCSMDNSRG